MTVSVDTIRTVVSLARQAPSADNCQPLRFHWDGRLLHITHDDERAAHPFNTNYTLSYLTLGCALEAIAVAAPAEGLQAQFELNDPSQGGATHWAAVSFTPDPAGRSGTATALLRRCTDRSVFRRGNLEDRVFCDLEAKGRARAHLRLRFAPPTRELVDYLTRVETLVWRWGPSQQGIAKWFRLSRREAEATRDGMTRQSMAVDAVSAQLLRLGRSDFKYQRLLNALGFLAIFGGRVRARIRSATAIGCVTVDRPRMETIVGAARLTMEAWLSLNESGYGFQALSASSELIIDQSRGLLPESIPSAFHDAAAEGRQLFARVFGFAATETPAWIFRTGVARKMPGGSASPRLPLSDMLTIDEGARRP